MDETKNYGTVEPEILFDNEDINISFIRGFIYKYGNNKNISKEEMIEYILDIINNPK